MNIKKYFDPAFILGNLVTANSIIVTLAGIYGLCEGITHGSYESLFYGTLLTPIGGAFTYLGYTLTKGVKEWID